MVYTTVTKIRLLTNLTTADISDTDVTNMITEATKQINSDLNVSVNREPISYINNTRQNKIDGVNKDFYVKIWEDKFLADNDNDGTVGTSDVIVYQVDSNGIETTLTVSSVDDDDCKITLSSAPSADKRLFISYSYSSIRELSGSIDGKLELATTFLTAAYIYAKINFGRAPSIAFGSTRLNRHMDAYQLYLDRYREIVNQINSLEEVHSKVSEDTF